MKNILSYKENTPILGKDMKDWIQYNFENKTSHYREAKFMSKYLETLNDNEYYTIMLSYEGTSCGSRIRHRPLIVKQIK